VILINKKATQLLNESSCSYKSKYNFLRFARLQNDLQSLASRQVVGWTLSKHPNAKLAQDALANAINRYKPNTKYLMFHSDQGTRTLAK
jgi:transposase InsO family protein